MEDALERIDLLVEMLQQRRLGFRMDEVMTGSHHFVAGAGPDGEHPMGYRITWGTRHLLDYLNPFGSGFMSNFLQGTISVGGLVEDAPCSGTLDLRYFQEAMIRYTIDFKGTDDHPYRYVGEKVDLRPWNLHKTHTTCYGTITDLVSGQDISKSIVYFKLDTIPAFMASIRLG